MTPWLAAALVIACMAREARAERAIVIDEPRGAPFAPDQLVAAIRMRIAADGAPIRLRVTPTSDGVRIETRGEIREVALAGMHGEDAARMVALAANDLLLDDLASGLPAPPRARAATEVPELGIVGAVAGWDGVLGSLALDVVLPRDGYLVALEAGGGELVAGELHLATGILRVDPGLRSGMFELRGGLTLAPVFVTSGSGDRTVLVGGNASVRLRLAVAPGMTAVLAGGVDAFATRTRYGLATMTIATPWVAPWFAAGVEIGL